MSDDEQVLVLLALRKKLLKVAERGVWGERIREQYLRFVPGFGTHERGCLKAALERTRNDEIELNLQFIQNVGEMQALPFAVLVEGAFYIEQRIGTSHAGGSVPQEEEIHRPLSIVIACACESYGLGF